MFRSKLNLKQVEPPASLEPLDGTVMGKHHRKKQRTAHLPPPVQQTLPLAPLVML